MSQDAVPTGQTRSGPEFPELGFYGLAGHTSTPKGLVSEVRLGEQLGLGSVFLSERFNTKDAGVMAGVAAAASNHLGIATAATNHNTRHPLVTATMAMTAHRTSEGRYALGLGRGFDMLFDLMGVPRVTGAQLADAIGIYRTLWRGGTVAGHDGPAGTFPYLSQDASFDENIPVMMMAVGDKTLELAGQVADAVVLHTFFSDDNVKCSVDIIRSAATAAGRASDSIRIWSAMGTVTDQVPEHLRLRKTVGRLATYLQGYGGVLVSSNRWDPADLEKFRADKLVNGYPGAFDAIGTTEELNYLKDNVLPAHWLEAMASGTPTQCAARIQDQLDAGADSVVLHGATPDELAPVLDEWRVIRPAHLNALPPNPGWAR